METEEEQQAAEPRAGGFFREPWLLGAGLCALAAVACLPLLPALFFLWRGLMDATFVAAALGVVAWFLNMRAKLRRDLPEEEDEEEETAGDESEDVGEGEL